MKQEQYSKTPAFILYYTVTSPLKNHDWLFGVMRYISNVSVQVEAGEGIAICNFSVISLHRQVIKELALLKTPSQPSYI